LENSNLKFEIWIQVSNKTLLAGLDRSKLLHRLAYFRMIIGQVRTDWCRTRPVQDFWAGYHSEPQL